MNLILRLLQRLINKLNIKNYSVQSIDGKFSDKKFMFTGGFQKYE